MKTIIEILKARFEKVINESVNTFFSLVLISGLLVSAWILLNVIFVMWIGGIYSSYILASAILIGIYLLGIGSLLLYRKKLIPKPGVESDTINPPHYLSSSAQESNAALKVKEINLKLISKRNSNDSLLESMLDLAIVKGVRLLDSDKDISNQDVEIDFSQSRIDS